MFADDVVLVADSRDALQRACTAFTRWADDNEMQVGIKKCGAMWIGGERPDGTAPLLLQGAAVPEVASYTYLRIALDDHLRPSTMTRYRAQRGNAALHALRPTLGNAHLPVAMRVMLIKSILLP
ncbi:hypothetical protein CAUPRSCDRAFT_4224, partial [Caulochytrium protostelioides]